MDILEEARVALLAQRARLGSSETPGAPDVLALATIEGAKAIGIDHLVGSLEEGKQADLAAFSLEGVAPTHDPIGAAVFAIDTYRAEFVTVAGQPLVRNRRLASPRAGLGKRMESIGDLLANWLASGGEMRGVV
jgi:5-methylthioadenosine/S-adenosylhomocysteine deaminase